MAEHEDSDKTAGSIYGFRTMRVSVSLRYAAANYRFGLCGCGCTVGGVNCVSAKYIKLGSTTFGGHLWMPGENRAMHLYVGGAGSHSRKYCAGRTAHKDCTCGFYAFYQLDRMMTSGDHIPSGIPALIEGYGRTTLHEYGFRSEKARLIGLANVTVADRRRHDTTAYSPYEPFQVDSNLVRDIAREWNVQYYASLQEMGRAVKASPELPQPQMTEEEAYQLRRETIRRLSQQRETIRRLFEQRRELEQQITTTQSFRPKPSFDQYKANKLSIERKDLEWFLRYNLKNRIKQEDDQ